jgi:hypothetical protein
VEVLVLVKTSAETPTSIAQGKPTDPNHIGSFAAENGAGTEGEMGEGSERIAASSGDNQNNRLGSCEAHHVSIGTQEDRSISAGEVGEGEGAAEEGCVATYVIAIRSQLGCRS